MMRKNQYLYFGLVTVVAEWVGLVLGYAYLHRLDPNKALSTATVAPAPLPLIFGLTLTVAGVTYAIFSLALRPYSRWIPYYAIIAGIAFSIAGWTRYTGYGGTQDVVHQISSYIALFGYLAMIWLLRSHPKRHISVASKTVTGVIVGALGLAVLTNYVFHQYFAYVQLLILISIQTWTVLVVWHERKINSGGHPSITEVE